jgi:hypothetical protein
MKKLLFTTLFLSVGLFSFAQFTTGVVSLTGSTRTIKIDTDASTVTMTLTGDSTHWLGIGFNGFSMSEVTDMFIWNSTSNRDYVAPGGHFQPSPDASGSQSWTIVSDNVSGGTRTVVATRPLVSAGDYTFLNNNSSINIIFSEGSSTTLGYHGNNPHAPQTLTRSALGTEDFSLNASLIYPNPSSGNFSIISKSRVEQISIYTLSGEFVKTIKAGSENSGQINVEGLSVGVYLVELKGANQNAWKKVIVE